MAKKGSFSKVYDKNGDYADVEAVRFDGTRTVQMQGDVTASQTWDGDPSSPLTLNASIGAKKVTQDKIGDKAVGTGQMADGSVGLTQMAASAMTDTVSANNNKLITSQGVNAAIAAATLNRGKDYGPLSVDEINAISETIPTGSTVYVKSLGASDAKVINDGYSDGTMASFSVEVGEDLKYYRAPDNSLHGWYSTEANVKVKQPANYSGGIAVDSAQDASSGSAGIEFIQSFKQNTNGDIRDIVKAQVDIVDSISSTRTNAAATPNSVKSAYDLANGKYSKPSSGIPKSDLASGVQTSLDKADSALQPTGDGKDLTSTVSTENNYTNPGSTATALKTLFGKIWNFIGRLRTSWQTTPDDSHFPSEKLVKDSLDTKADGFVSVSSTDVPSLLSELLQYKNAVFGRFQNTTAYTKDSETLPVGFFTFIYNPIIERAASIQYATISLYPVSDISYANPFVFSIRGGSVYFLLKLPSSVQLDLKAPLASPALTGTPTAPTAASGTDTTQIATTAFVQREIGSTQDVGKSFGAAISSTPDASGYYWQKLCTATMGGYAIKTLIFSQSMNDTVPNCIYFLNITRQLSGTGAPTTAEIKIVGNVPPNKNKRKYAYTYDATTNVVTVYTASQEVFAMRPMALRNSLFTLSESSETTAIPDSTTDLSLCVATHTSGGYVNTGSSSVPVWVDSDGKITACTDTFVNNIEYVANQSGGGGNLNKTINGTTTSVLAFMNDSEAVAIWNDAKTAAANAS